MKEKILEFFKKIVQSLDTEKGGFSARKLTALGVMISVMIGNSLYYRYASANNNWALFPEIKFIDYGMVAVLLGLTTWEGIKRKDEPKE
jgi:hypothetical protein